MVVTERPKVLSQRMAPEFALYNADCVEAMRGLPGSSIHYSMFSPPFVALYTFSDSPRDVSNNSDERTFWDHYRFVIEGVFRLLKPGRLLSIHCMDLPTSLSSDGFIGLVDFPGQNIKLCQDAGFIYHSRVFIRKDPVVAMQRTKALGLLHKQLVKDSAMSRMTIGDSIITFRKPGLNPEPVAGPLQTYRGDDVSDQEFTAAAKSSWRRSPSDPSQRPRTLEDHKSILIWQKYAEAVWTDISPSDVLSNRMARDAFDERHISPLQLTPVRRCLDLWTNPGDIVFSPFAGIGTVGYVALEMRRRFVGVELKPSYYRQAVANLQVGGRRRGSLFEERSE